MKISKNNSCLADYHSKERIISYGQWERLYKPICSEGCYKDFHPYSSLGLDDKAVFDIATTEKRIWTEVAENYYWTILPGLFYVNTVAYYITDKPCRLNLVVEDKMEVLELKVTLADAKELLMALDQGDYPTDETLPQKSCYLDISTVDDYRMPIEALCRKYHRCTPDALELTW